MTTKEKDQSAILSQLEHIKQKGVTLYLDGQSATPDEIVSSCVNDETSYMPDYVIDDTGVLREIRYDKVVFR